MAEVTPFTYPISVAVVVAGTKNPLPSDTIALVDRIRDRFGDVDIVFTQIGSTASLTNARIATIRYYIREICRTDANCHMIGGMINLKTAGLYTDDFHLNQTGQNAIGNMYARWMKNSSYPKWARMIISSHVDELSTNRKSLIASIDDHLTSYFNHDCLFFFKQTTANNAWLDWTFNTILNNSLAAVTFTANTAISTNGTAQYCRPGFVPSFTNLISSQNDIFMAVKFYLQHTRCRSEVSYVLSSQYLLHRWPYT